MYHGHKGTKTDIKRKLLYIFQKKLEPNNIKIYSIYQLIMSNQIEELRQLKEKFSFEFSRVSWLVRVASKIFKIFYPLDFLIGYGTLFACLSGLFITQLRIVLLSLDKARNF